jgi:hypothetical protein
VLPNRDREGVTMGLRPTKGDEDNKWGGPPGPRGSPRTRSSGVVDFLTKPTRVSTADQGVRPTYVFKGALPRQEHALRSLAVAVR